jgi:hydroxymethylbilane synthase
VKPLRIGSRGSALALWQAGFVRDWLVRAHRAEIEIIIIKTSGDQFQQTSVAAIGLKGVFIKELEDALLDGRVDLAVHSMKDVPTEIPPGLVFPAITRRDDARDCLLSREGRTLAQLPDGARVGTSSLRRQAQLLRVRPGLAAVDLRGNVDTRIRKLDEGQFEAILLAKAGVDRLGRSERITEVLSPDVMLPAVGQGALGVETREGDHPLREIVAGLDDGPTRAAVTAERALLAELEGGCQVPLGAWGRIEAGELRLDACVCSADGKECIRDTVAGSAESPDRLGRALARRLLDGGADRILRLAGRTLGRD